MTTIPSRSGLNPFTGAAALALTLILTACGGGGGGGGGAPPPGGGAAPPGGAPSATSLELTLTEGGFWTFIWNSSRTSFAQPNTTTTSADHGSFTVTLGVPVTLSGSTAFPLIVTGDPGEFTPRWSHLAASADGSLLGSTDGVTLEPIFNAETASWVGGGFFIEFAADEAVNLAADTFDGEYNTVSALAASHGTSEGGCETILGITVCSDTSTTFSEREFYKQGIGPIGFLRDISFSSSGGGFFTSTQINITVELIDSSLSATDGTVFNPPPWEEVAPLNTARSSHSAVVLNGEIYVLGGFDGTNSLSTVEIYNPTTNQWRFGTPMPGTGGNAEVVNGKIYVHPAGGNDVFVFDPATGWSTVTPTPGGAGSFGIDSATYNDVTFGFGNIIVGVTQVSVLNRVMDVVAYTPTTNQWLSGVGLSTAEWLRPSVSVVGDIMYVIGGFGQQGSRGAMSRVAAYDQTTDTWSSKSSMGTARDNNSAVALGGKIYVLGGNAVGCGLTDCTVGATHRSGEVYDPQADAWTPIPAMFAARKSFDAVVLNGKIYAIGGSAGGTERLAAVERFTPP